MSLRLSRRSVPIVTVAGVVLATASFLVLALAPPAQGVVRYYVRGQPGAATMPPMYGWYGGYTLDHTLRFSARTVQRSRAAPRSTQQICVQYKLYHFLPSYLGERPQWARAWSSGWACRFIQPGAAMNVGSLDYRPIPQKAYNAEVWVTWNVGSRQIAVARYDYNRTADYQCQTINCWTDYGYGGHAYISIDY